MDSIKIAKKHQNLCAELQVEEFVNIQGDTSCSFDSTGTNQNESHRGTSSKLKDSEIMVADLTSETMVTGNQPAKETPIVQMQLYKEAHHQLLALSMNTCVQTRKSTRSFQHPQLNAHHTLLQDDNVIEKLWNANENIPHDRYNQHYVSS
jgi:hypothetical protein